MHTTTNTGVNSITILAIPVAIFPPIQLKKLPILDVIPSTILSPTFDHKPCSSINNKYLLIYPPTKMLSLLIF